MSKALSADIALLVSAHRYSLSRLGGAVILSIMYAHDVAPKDDHFVYLADTAAEQLTAHIFAGTTLFFAFPSIFRHIPAWFPGAGFKKFAHEARKVAFEMRDIPLAIVQKQMVCTPRARCVLFNLFCHRKKDWQQIVSRPLFSKHASQKKNLMFSQVQRLQAIPVRYGSCLMPYIDAFSISLLTAGAETVRFSVQLLSTYSLTIGPFLIRRRQL